MNLTVLFCAGQNPSVQVTQTSMTEATQGLYASGGTAAGDATSSTHLSASPGDDITRQWSAVSESSERRGMLDTTDQNVHMSSQETIYVATDSMRIRDEISSSLLSDGDNQQHDIQETVEALIEQRSSDRDERLVGATKEALTTRDLESRVGVSGSLYDDPTPYQFGHEDLEVPGDTDTGSTRDLLAPNEKITEGSTQYQRGTVDFHEEILTSFAHSTNRSEENHDRRGKSLNALATTVASHEERREVNEVTRSTLKQESSKTGADLSHVSAYA